MLKYGESITKKMIESRRQLEYQIIVILCEIELFEEHIEKYRDKVDLSDSEFVKAVFNSHLESNWECDFANLHKRIDYLAGLPFDPIPSELFRAAMQDASKNVDWDRIAQNENVRERIEFLKSSQSS